MAASALWCRASSGGWGLDEIDANLHMNQAAYAQVGELGRTDWAFGSGAWERWKRHRVKPVVAEQRIIYRRELKPLQRYLIDTRAVGVEGRLLAVETHLLVGSRVHARLELKLIFIAAEGVAAPERVAEVNGPLLTDPLAIEDWRAV